MNTNENLSRRAFVGRGLAAGALTLVGALVATRAADQSAPTLVDPDEPTAKAVEYAPTSPKADQKCGGCALYQGKADDPQGPCLLFQGRSVTGAGWCKGWTKKS
jgi:hypothetical protein